MTQVDRSFYEHHDRLIADRENLKRALKFPTGLIVGGMVLSFLLPDSHTSAEVVAQGSLVAGSLWLLYNGIQITGINEYLSQSEGEFESNRYDRSVEMYGEED